MFMLYATIHAYCVLFNLCIVSRYGLNRTNCIIQGQGHVGPRTSEIINVNKPSSWHATAIGTVLRLNLYTRFVIDIL